MRVTILVITVFALGFGFASILFGHALIGMILLVFSAVVNIVTIPAKFPDEQNGE